MKIQRIFDVFLLCFTSIGWAYAWFKTIHEIGNSDWMVEMWAQALTFPTLFELAFILWLVYWITSLQCSCIKFFWKELIWKELAKSDTKEKN